MKNQFCIDIGLDFVVDNSFINNIIVDDNLPHGFKQFDIQKSLLDRNLIKFLKKCQVEISHAEAFYTLPGKKIPIHVDHTQIDNHCKLNFVYGDSGSVMQWWKINDLTKPFTVRETPIKTKYLVFNDAECSLIWEASVGCPSLVNAGQPHSVLNCTDSPRKTLSLVLYDLEKQRLLDWDDAMDRFKNQLLHQMF
jgi:hypothetical protein